MKKLSLMATFIGAVSLLCGCNHVHDKNAKWQYNETTHWKKCSCGEEFDKGEHSINEDDCNCPTCGYHDPMFVVNDKGLLTGLTNFGKNYKGVLEKDDTVKHNDFSKANTIGENAFVGCQASEIIVPDGVNAVHVSNFTGEASSKLKFEYEGKLVTPTDIQWVEHSDGYKYKENVYKNNVAMVNGLFYPTLKEAIDSVKEDNTIIKIVKESYDAVTVEHGSYFTVKHKTILESLSETRKTDLKANFEVFNTAQLEIDPSVTYSGGSTNLGTQLTRETCGTEKIACLETSTLYFPGLSEAPKGPTIYYHDTGGGNSYTALGDVQTYKDAILEKEVSCYAYGVFKFERESKNITGLTTFGQTITKLSISEFWKDNDTGSTDFGLAKYAFNSKDKRPIEITIGGEKRSFDVTGHFQKGIFNQLHIKSGIKEIPEGTFSFIIFDRDRYKTNELKEIERKISKLSYVELDKCVEVINEEAFREACSLIDFITKDEGTGAGLREIKKWAFRGCDRLQTFDVSNSENLIRIGVGALSLCYNLNGIKLANVNAWGTENGNFHFAPIDLTEANLKNVFVHYYENNAFVRESINHQYYGAVYGYHPNDKDSYGIHNCVTNFKYVGHLNHPQIFNNLKEGSYVRVTQEYFKNAYNKSDEESTDPIFIKSGHSVYIKNDGDQTLKLNNFVVEPGAYVIFGDNIQINGEVKLQKSGLMIGSCAFAGKPNLGNTGKITLDNSVAIGFEKTRMNFSGEELNDCTLYGVYNYSYNDLYIQATSFSKLAQMCKNLSITKQSESDIYGKSFFAIVQQFSQNNNCIENLTIGDEVDELNASGDGGAFANCSNLTTVKCGGRLRGIGKSAFKNCQNLREFDVSKANNLEYIYSYAFENCQSLNSFILGDNNKEFRKIDGNAFKNTPLSWFYMPPGIRSGWTVKKKTLDAKEFEDPRHAAQLIRVTYATNDWNR